MPIESLTAGPPAVAGPGATSATKASAPPGFTAALEQATKTWTAQAEGQTKKQHTGNDRPAANPTDAPADAHEATAAAKPATADAKLDVKDAEGEAKAADGAPVDPAATVVIDPAVLAAAQAAAAQAAVVVAEPTAPTPAAPTAAAPTAASVDPAQVALIATQVQAAATAVAAGQPVDPAAPGVAELLQSVASGETDIADLPPAVQTLVAKATAQLAEGQSPATDAKATPATPATPTTPATAAAPVALTTPDVAKTTAPASAAAAAAVTAPPVDGAPTSESAPSLSPLAAAIQAAAQAQTGGDAQSGAGDDTSQPPLAAALPPSAAPDADGTPAAPAFAQTPVDVPLQVASAHENGSFAAAPVATATIGTAAAPATPTVSGATPGVQAAAIEALVQLSRTRGQSSARIALAPEQLGGIQVTLVFGADGVTARMIAERPEAAAALQRAGQDLRDALQQQGVDLARLETSFAGDQRQGQGDRSASGTGTGTSGGHGGGQSGRDGSSDNAQTIHVSLDEPQAPEPLQPGRLVDLRA